MKQKLAVARTLLHRPAIIFLDEPTAGFDPISAAALRDDLSRLAQDAQVTVFLNTHNLAEAEKLCTLVGVIKAGKLLALDHPDVLRRHDGAARVEIVADNISEEILSALRSFPGVAAVAWNNGHLIIDQHHPAPAAPLVSFLVQHGAAVEEVHKGKASLEDVFLSLMEDS